MNQTKVKPKSNQSNKNQFKYISTYTLSNDLETFFYVLLLPETQQTSQIHAGACGSGTTRTRPCCPSS